MLWTVKLDGGPSGPFYTDVAVRDKIYSFGGYNNQDPRVPITVQRLETGNYRWSVLTNSQLDEIPYYRVGHTAVAYNDLVYIWGGKKEAVNCNDLLCFDTNTHQWSKPTVSGMIPAPRSGHSACVINDAMLIFGGFDTHHPQQEFQDVYKLDLKNLKWSYVNTGGNPPTSRNKHSATLINNHMYIFGGIGSGGNAGVFCNDIIYLDTLTMNWIRPELKGLYRPIGRLGHLAFSYRDQLYLFGGWNGRPIHNDSFNQLLRYDPVSCIWSIVDPRGNGPFSRFGQRGCLIGDRVLLVGGMRTAEDDDEYDQIFFDDLHVLDFAPTLRTLSMMTVFEHKLDRDELPETIQSEIKMTLPSSGANQTLKNAG